MEEDLQFDYNDLSWLELIVRGMRNTAGTSPGIDTAYRSVVEHHRAAVEAFMANPESMEGDQPVLVPPSYPGL